MGPGGESEEFCASEAQVARVSALIPRGPRRLAIPAGWRETPHSRSPSPGVPIRHGSPCL